MMKGYILQTSQAALHSQAILADSIGPSNLPDAHVELLQQSQIGRLKLKSS